MNTRSKLIAAVLGLVVAAGAMGDASARTFHKIAKPHAVVATSKTVLIRKAHRPLIGTRLVQQVRVAHRAPIIVKHVRVVHRAPIVVRKVVRVTKRPLFFAHRTLVKKTVIR